MLLPSPAPGRPVAGRPGALLCALLVLLAAACGGDRRSGAEARHRLPLGRDTIDLGREVAVHDVRLSSAGAITGITPATVNAYTGDVLRFVAADSRGHAVGFDEASLAPDVRAFLAGSRQLRGPPLISTGASWVVSLKGAPAGNYPFHSLTGGAGGLLIVRARPGK